MVDFPKLEQVLLERFEESRKKLTQTILAGTFPIEPALTDHCKTVDKILIEHAQTYDLPKSGFAIIARGGHGQGYLFPRSDIDTGLLLNDDGDADKFCEFIGNHNLLTVDMGLEGHIITTGPNEIRSRDAVYLTSLLNARLLLGDPSVLDHTLEIIRHEIEPFIALLGNLQSLEQGLQQDNPLSSYIAFPKMKETIRLAQHLEWIKQVQKETGMRAPAYLHKDISHHLSVLRFARAWLHAKNLDLPKTVHKDSFTYLQTVEFNETMDRIGGYSAVLAAVDAVVALAQVNESRFNSKGIELTKGIIYRHKKLNLDTTNTQFCNSQTLAALLKLATRYSINIGPSTVVYVKDHKNMIERGILTGALKAGVPSIDQLKAIDEMGVFETLIPNYSTLATKVYDSTHRLSDIRLNGRALQRVSNLRTILNDKEAIDQRIQSTYEKLNENARSIVTLALLAKDCVPPNNQETFYTDIAAKNGLDTNQTTLLRFLIQNMLPFHQSAVSAPFHTKESVEKLKNQYAVLGEIGLHALLITTCCAKDYGKPELLDQSQFGTVFDLHQRLIEAISARSIKKVDIRDYTGLEYQIASELPYSMQHSRFLIHEWDYPRAITALASVEQGDQTCDINLKQVSKTRYTLTVCAANRRYLLRDITRALYQQGANVTSSEIHSHKRGLAYDIFQIEFGHDKNELKTDLSRALSKPSSIEELTADQRTKILKGIQNVGTVQPYEGIKDTYTLTITGSKKPGIYTLVADTISSAGGDIINANVIEDNPRLNNTRETFAFTCPQEQYVNLVAAVDALRANIKV